LFDIEYNLIFTSLFSILFAICVILTGYFSKNKYAVLASVRTSIGSLNLELFLGLMILNVILISESFSFLSIVILQENY
jgi:NADH:ubiquinone oxidoreductase subunit H